MQIDQSSFTKAFHLRDQLRLPIRVCQMLDYQQTAIKETMSPTPRQFFPAFCSSPIRKKKKYFIDDQFIATFSKMTLQEKIALYCKSIYYLKLISEGQNEPRLNIQHTNFNKVLIKGGNFGISWIQYNLKINPQLGTLEMSGQENAVIDLHDYLVRSSNYKRRQAFVLQAVRPGFSEVFRLGFDDSSTFQRCFHAVSLLVDKCIFQNLMRQIQGMKQFQLAFQEKEPKPNHLQLSKSHVKNEQDIESLLASYIQRQIKPYCISSEEIALDELEEKFEPIDKKDYRPGQLFPLSYNEEQLFEGDNYLTSNSYLQNLQQLKTDPTIFRLNKIYEFPVQSLINCLSDVEYYQKWNHQIKTAKIVSSIKGQNSIIISQIHKPLVKYYEARIFMYIRTLFLKENTIYIVDKPVVSVIKPQLQHFIKGTVAFGVWKLTPKDINRTIVEGIVKLDHKIIKNKDIEVKLTGMYMEGFLKIDQYLKSNNQRTVKIFDKHKTEQSFNRITAILYQQSSRRQNNTISINAKIAPPTKQMNLEAKIPPIKFDDDQFYSAVGRQDWNTSKRGSLSKQSSLQDLKNILPTNIKSVKILQNTIPITQVLSANASNSSQSANQSITMLLKKSSKQSMFSPTIKMFKQTSPLVIASQKNHFNQSQVVGSFQQFTPILLPLVKINSSTNKSSCQESYNAHIALKSSVMTNQIGMCVIPHNCFSQPFPFPSSPKPDYPYIKLTGPSWNHYFRKDLWTILPNGELKCTNDVVLKAQTRVFATMLKKFTTSIIAGNGINVSIPVDVFSDMSILQLITRGMCFGPLFLERAAKSSQSIERLKYAICFVIGFIFSYLQMGKPFNPILGETYQAWINGCPFYAEQTCHHPAISTFLFVGRGYKVYGSITPEIQLSMNSAVGFNTGWYTVEFERFPDNKIHFQPPGGQMIGLAYGERKFGLFGKAVIYDDLNQYCQIAFNPDKKSLFSFSKQKKQVDILQSHIYKIQKSQIQELKRNRARDGLNKKHLKNIISTISGRYTEKVLFDGVQYFDINKDQPCSYEQEAYPLESNSNYRQDIFYKKHNDCPKSEEHKDRLEKIQRRDKKLREHTI